MLSVTVRARMVDAGRPLTCAARGPGRFRVFDLVDLSADPAAPGVDPVAPAGTPAASAVHPGDDSAAG